MLTKVKGQVVNKYTNPASYGGGYFIIIKRENTSQTVILETSETLFNTVTSLDHITVTPHLFTNKIKTLKKEGFTE